MASNLIDVIYCDSSFNMMCDAWQGRGGEVKTFGWRVGVEVGKG